jgi:peptidoglycan/xylan/chitin deacetylase (PgdA/CDA1 family)
MMANNYPRDLLGYGRNPPHAHWPGDARIAVQFVINYEEGGENCILHGDAASEAFLSEIINAEPWPGQRHMNMESIYEYGSRVGFWRLWRLFTDRRLPVTVYGVATALQRNPEVVAAMREVGWEIGRLAPLKFPGQSAAVRRFQEATARPCSKQAALLLRS